MRSPVLAPKFRAFFQTSALIAITGLASACSSDFSRLDQQLITATTLTDNQQSIIKAQGPVSQPYPGDVVASNAGQSLAAVKQQASSALPVGNPTSLAPQVARAPLDKVADTRQVASNTVGRFIAPKSQATGQGIVLQPRKTAVALREMGADTMSTGSISTTPKKPQLKAPATVGSTGWSKTQGTQVALRSGETIHNLSRRFGVPVKAIMSANGIKDANAVEAGRNILIPKYNYGANAPVSAPDSNPVTHASRSSRGFQGQAHGKVAVPKIRKAPSIDTPVEAATTGALQHVVVKGDTLSGIARRYGVSTAALRSANGLSNDTVRLGARLALPGAAADSGSPVDPVTTSSLPNQSKSSAVASATAVKKVATNSQEQVDIGQKAKEKVETTASTSAGTFRWPARGRIISKFGERVASGTNDGIDISVPVGTPVKVSENGTVIYSGSELEDFGKLILVSHANGWVSAYAHSSANLVKRGDKVVRGQVIAKSGRSGNATVPKLHFELRRDSNPVNPLKHLSQ